jgi:hypothetical protein
LSSSVSADSKGRLLQTRVFCKEKVVNKLEIVDGLASVVLPSLDSYKYITFKDSFITTICSKNAFNA